MARSVWKGPFVDLYLLKKAETAQDANSSAPINMQWSSGSRRSRLMARAEPSARIPSIVKPLRMSLMP